MSEHAAPGEVRISAFDPVTDDARLAGWVAAGTEAAAAEFGDQHTVYTVQEVRERQRQTTDRDITLLVAQLGDDGEVVGEAALHLPLLDNLHLAFGFLTVRPSWRRRGIGAALLADLETRARTAGRTTICVESDVAADRPAAAERFAPQHGYSRALVNLRSDLVLPDGSLESLLAGLEAEAELHAGDYDLLTWWDGVPEQWLDQRAALAARMVTDAPMGDVEQEEEHWDAQRVLEVYRVAKAQGRRVVETVAVHRDSGRLAAYTTIGVPAHDRTAVYQWDTLVLSEHRGHRLGQAVKARNLRALRAELPDVRRVVTWNAEQNGPMLRVNRELGFRTVGLNTEWQKRL